MNDPDKIYCFECGAEIGDIEKVTAFLSPTMVKRIVETVGPERLKHQRCGRCAMKAIFEEPLP